MLNTLQSTLDILKENSNISMEDIENIIKRDFIGEGINIYGQKNKINWRQNN